MEANLVVDQNCFEFCPDASSEFANSFVKDYICNPRFDLEECCHDLGDCENSERDICPTCKLPSQLSNHYCNPELDTIECCFDSGDCFLDSYQCPSCTEEDMSWFRDSVCDVELNTESCCFDGGDCPCPACNLTSPTTHKFYNPAIGNLHCDYHLNTQECCFDGFDCSATNRYKKVFIKRGSDQCSMSSMQHVAPCFEMQRVTR